MSKFLDRYRFNGDMVSVHASATEILGAMSVNVGETAENKIVGTAQLRALTDPKEVANRASSAENQEAKEADAEPGNVTIEIDFTMLSESKTQARITVTILGGRQTDMTPRCHTIGMGIVEHIDQTYSLEVAQARPTELPPETKQRISLPFLIAVVVVLLIASAGIYTVYNFLTPDRTYEKATKASKKKQRMENKGSEQTSSGPPQENDSENAGKQKAPKPAIMLALSLGPVSPRGCVLELELSKPSSLPLLLLHADVDFVGMGSTVLVTKNLKLDLNADPMRSKYSGDLALPNIPCNVVSEAIIADVTACQVRDKPSAFCRKMVKEDPRSKFPIRRF